MMRSGWACSLMYDDYTNTANREECSWSKLIAFRLTVCERSCEDCVTHCSTIFPFLDCKNCWRRRLTKWNEAVQNILECLTWLFSCFFTRFFPWINFHVSHGPQKMWFSMSSALVNETEALVTTANEFCWIFIVLYIVLCRTYQLNSNSRSKAILFKSTWCNFLSLML